VNALCINAQNNHSEPETQIRKLEEKEDLTMLHQDAGVLKSIWASDFMVNAPFNRVTLSSQEVIDLVKKGIIKLLQKCA
jgi:hypothetical protein